MKNILRIILCCFVTTLLAQTSSVNVKVSPNTPAGDVVNSLVNFPAVGILKIGGVDVTTTGGGGGLGTANYNFNTTTSAPPSNSQIRVNNSDQTLATTLWINYTDNNNRNLKTYIAYYFVTGAKVYLQKNDNPSIWQLYQISSSITDNTTYATVPVTFQNGGGTPIGGGNSIMASVTSPSGATAGGLNQQFQYNNTGALGGITSLTYDGTIPATATLNPAANTHATGVLLRNTTASTSGNQRYAPDLTLGGHAFLTGSGDHSYTWRLATESQDANSLPVSASLPYSWLRIGFSYDGGAYDSHGVIIDSRGNMFNANDGVCAFAEFDALDTLKVGNPANKLYLTNFSSAGGLIMPGTLANTRDIVWTSTSDADGTVDVGISRDAAGRVGIFDTSAHGGYRDLKLRTLLLNPGAAPTGVEGALYGNSTDHKIYYYNGSSFVDLTAGGGASPVGGSITTHGDSNYSIASSDRIVVTNANLSAVRTWTLPSASSAGAGTVIQVIDLQGGVTPTNNLFVTKQVGDTLLPAGTGPIITEPYSGVEFTSNGVTTWEVTNWVPRDSTTPFGGSGHGMFQVWNNNNRAWQVAPWRFGDIYTTTPAVGNFLQATSTTDYGTSTYKLPTSPGASGKIAQSNGTDIVMSTPTWPSTAGTKGQSVRWDGTNMVTNGAPYGVLTVTNDQTATTETAHIVYTVPANSAAGGTTYRLTAWGDMDNGTTAITFTPRIRWGGTGGTQLIATPTVVGTTTAQTNKQWRAVANVTIRSIGASGTCWPTLAVANHTASTAGAYAADEATTTATVTIDTTANKDLDLTWSLSATTGTPHVRTYGGYVEIIN